MLTKKELITNYIRKIKYNPLRNIRGFCCDYIGGNINLDIERGAFYRNIRSVG